MQVLLDFVQNFAAMSTALAVTQLGIVALAIAAFNRQRKRRALARAADMALLRKIDMERELLASLIEGLNAGTWEWNVQTGETRCTERWAEITGYTLAELQPISMQTWLDAAHPEDIGRSEEMLQRHFAGLSPHYDCEVRVRHKDGHWVWVRNHGTLKSRTADGQPDWMFGIHLDVSLQLTQERDLIFSEALLEEIGELALVGGWSMDLDTHVLHWTAQTRRIHAVSDDFIPTVEAAIQFYAPAELAVLEAAITKGIAEGIGWDLELPLLRADGRSIWVRAVGRPVHDAEGRVARLVGALQDVTVAHAQRLELFEARERLEAATEAASIGVWSVELDTGATVWDRQVYLLHGEVPFSRQPTHEFWLSHVHPEDRNRISAESVQAFSSFFPHRTTYRVVWPDGSIRHLESFGRNVADDEGRLIRVIGTNRDITTETFAKESLNIANRRLGLATESGSIGVWELDVQSGALWWDEQMYQLYGYVQKPVAPVYDTWAARLHPSDRTFAEGELAKAVQDPSHEFNIEFRVVWPDGSIHSLKAMAKITREADGSPICMTGVNWDVTAQRGMESALTLANTVLEVRVTERTRELEIARDAAQAANLAKSEFLANMSHELRTPLHSILGFAKLLQDDLVDAADEAVGNYAARIVKSGDQLLGLVDDLLDSAKIDYGGFSVAIKRADMSLLVSGVVDEFVARSGSGSRIKMRAPQSLPMMFDPARMAQVVRNLLANAVRLSPKGTLVEVAIDLDAVVNGVSIQVSDRGPGIPENEIDLIFERFSQSSKTKNGAGGTGLGLPIARSIVELHGGSLSAENREGGGAIFTVVLPLDRRASSQAEALPVRH